MRTLIFVVLFVFQLACSKKDIASPESSSFSFSADDKSFSWNFDFLTPSPNGYGLISKRVGVGGPRSGYMISGSNQSQNVSTYLFIETDSLTTGTFKSETTISTGYIQSGYIINGIVYNPMNLGDSVVVTISNISGNKGSGTFNAVMHDFNTRSNKVVIKNGQFNNLLISK